MWSCIKVIEMGYSRASGGDAIGAAEVTERDMRERVGVLWDSFVAE